MKHLSPKQKASIALAALRGEKISKLSSDYQVHPNQIGKWKKLAEEELAVLFTDKRKKENHSQERIIDELYQTIGRREVEISWLKKNSSLSYPERLTLANKEHPDISTLRQAELLDISRSSIYYQPTVNPGDIQIMNSIDKIFTQCPFYGHRRIKPELKEEYGINIGKKRIISLMKEMGLNAIYPRPKLNLSSSDKQHKKFPYLLKGLPIIRPNQVWGTDITYIKLKKYFAYLVAILDWYSRYVVAWKLSPTLENIFCIQALEQALKINKTEVHNSDQGAQYTSLNYINILEESEIRISMDGRGRCMDNIFTERLWRTVKYENIYLNEYADIGEAGQGLSEYFKFYNEKRRHQSLDYKTPAQIYFAKY